jgi:hypothetical protein
MGLAALAIYQVVWNHRVARSEPTPSPQPTAMVPTEMSVALQLGAGAWRAAADVEEAAPPPETPARSDLSAAKPPEAAAPPVEAVAVSAPMAAPLSQSTALPEPIRVTTLPEPPPVEPPAAAPATQPPPAEGRMPLAGPRDEGERAAPPPRQPAVSQAPHRAAEPLAPPPPPPQPQAGKFGPSIFKRIDGLGGY